MDSKERIDTMVALVKASGQYEMTRISIEKWVSLGKGAKMIGFMLPMNRIKCPSCGMRGASFQSCDVCGGPACDNCRNMSKGMPICSVCKDQK
jgi:hypothetical protein